MSLLNGFRLKEINTSQLPPSLFQGLQRVTQTPGILRTDDLESADQVWVIQCPKSANLCSLMEGKKLILDSGEKTTTFTSPENDKVYESICITSEDEGQGVSLLLPDVLDNIKLVSAPLAGTILIREALEELEPPQVIETHKPHHTLPQGIKIRHPIYGVDFSEILTEMENAQDIDQVDSLSSHKKKHKHKKSKHRHREEEEVIPIKIIPETQVPVLVSENTHKKKHSKKRKRDENEDEIFEQIDLEPEPVPPFQSAKRLKREPIIPEPEEDESTSTTHKKKKKKHHRDREDEEEPEQTAVVKIELESNGHDHESQSKKHKKKHKKSKYD